MKNIRETCKKGHKYTETSFDNNGRRKCIECARERYLRHYYAHQIENREKARDRYNQNREKEIRRSAEYNKNHRSEINEKRRQKYIENTDEILTKQRRYYRLNNPTKKFYDEQVGKIKANGCKYCDEKEPVCIDLHHRNENEKLFNVSKWMTRPKEFKTREILMNEIAKCDPVCSNCHRKLHADLPLPKVTVVGAT